jgi:hypothetical protein
MIEVVERYDSLAEVGWHWIDVVSDPAMDPAAALAGEGCRWCTAVL